MKKMRWVFIGLSIAGLILSLQINNPSTAKPVTGDRLHYDLIERSRHTIHTLTIPHASNYIVVPAVSGELKLLSEFVEQEQAVAAINGGYFDPVNQRTTSFVFQESKNVADPRFNARLVDNPDLKQYLSKIFNRAEFRRYSCGGETQYDIQLHSAPIPSNCTLNGSLGGGPGLLPEDTSVAEAFTAYKDGEKIRDAIGRDSFNARSAIAITEEGDVILAMVAQQPDKPLDSGISLPELTDFLSSLGAVKAMNLDGGSSAALYYGDRTIYGRVDKEGNKIQRPIKSVLLVTKNQ